MADEFGFRVLDARRKVDVIQDELRRQIGAFLAEADATQLDRRRVTARPESAPLFTRNLHRRNWPETTAGYARSAVA